MLSLNNLATINQSCLIKKSSRQTITAKQINTFNPKIEKQIKDNIKHCLVDTNLKLNNTKKLSQGKVRDIYENDDSLIFITTDRQSAFDRVLAQIPFKGQVLNMTSAWWFEKTKHIVDNALINVPDPSVSVMKKLEVIPIEFIVRGYITGTTETSLWTHYNNGVRNYCDNILPEGMKKNEKLMYNIVTPTTKGVVDRPISPQEIISQEYMTEYEWYSLSTIALKLFAFGQFEAANRGLILVDTKYEFGKDKDGKFYLIDEIHTPDSSRYWISDTYNYQMSKGLEPDNIDKEFLRRWFVENSNPYEDAILPEAPTELVCELSKRYIYLYETITGNEFRPVTSNENDKTRMEQIYDSFLSN